MKVVGSSDEKAGEGKPKKERRRKEEELEAAKEMIKRSDIKVSNPLIINDFKRTTSNLAEGVKVKEGAF